MSAFTACSNEDEMPQMAQINGSELVVNNVGVAEVNTKAGIRGTEFTGSEQIGLFIYTGAKGTMTGDYNTTASTIPTVNVPYGRNAGKWSATQPIILSSTKGVVYGYYPYTSGDTYKTPTAIPVTVAADQGSGQSDGKVDVTEQKDFMYATAVENISNANATISTLTMNHALAMVTFVFQQTSEMNNLYPGEGKVSEIVLKNVDNTKSAVKTGNGTMNSYDGVTTGGSAKVGDLPASITISPAVTKSLMGVTTTNEGTGELPQLPRMLVYPNEGVAAGYAEAIITVDGNKYKVAIPALTITDGKWQKGNNYKYTLTMKGTGLVVENVAIEDWVGQEAGTGTIQTPTN